MTADFVIVGGGITGLAAARELQGRSPKAKIMVLEKEQALGMHSSGRNSGVLHSGIYYPSESLKARFCAAGRKLMQEFCEDRGLPVDVMGKVIVPKDLEQDSRLELLNQRAAANGARAQIIGEQELLEVEPVAKSASGRALYSPETAVVDPVAVLAQLRREFEAAGGTVLTGAGELRFDADKMQLAHATGKIAYGHLINCAGFNADRVARQFGVAESLTMLPFKGNYYGLSPASPLRFSGLIYPVPDLNMPFLGIHSCKSVTGAIYFGPSAVPVFGRENYEGWRGIGAGEAIEITWHLIGQWLANKQHFRNYAREAARRLTRKSFAEAAAAIVKGLGVDDLVPCGKAGIRAQCLDVRKRELVMDFLVEKGPASTHVLNVVSPGFTSSLAFAAYVVDEAVAACA